MIGIIRKSASPLIHCVTCKPDTSGSWMSISNQIRMMLTSKRKRLDTVLGLQCTIAVSDEEDR